MTQTTETPLIYLPTIAITEDKKAHPVEEIVVEGDQSGSVIDEVPDGGMQAWSAVLSKSPNRRSTQSRYELLCLIYSLLVTFPHMFWGTAYCTIG